MDKYSTINLACYIVLVLLFQLSIILAVTGAA